MNETNHKKILQWLSDGEWHCATEIGYMWDLRKRISELNDPIERIVGIPCDGRCGTIHKSKNLKMRKLHAKPQEVTFAAFSSPVERSIEDGGERGSIPRGGIEVLQTSLF